ncbi:unnamed protein product [Schistosoma turkestanicum]|nr:unnamed protein product [Schistosoma turkestanicum]
MFHCTASFPLQASSSPKQLKIPREFSPINQLKYRNLHNRHYSPNNNSDSDNDVDDDDHFDQNSNCDKNANIQVYDIDLLKNSFNHHYTTNSSSTSITQIDHVTNHLNRTNDPLSSSRFTENVYIREEEDDSCDDDDDDGVGDSDDSRHSIYYVNRKMSTTATTICTYIHNYYYYYYYQLRYVILCMAFILVCIFGVYIILFIDHHSMFNPFNSFLLLSISTSTSSSSSVHEQSLPSVQKINIKELTNQLSEEFPNQHKRLWAQIRSALESSFQYKYTNHQQHTMSQRIPPVVLLLVNRYIHSIVNNQSNQPYSTLLNQNNQNHNNDKSSSSSSFHCFISRLSELLVNSEYLSNFKNSCSILEAYHQFSDVNKQELNQMKLDFDSQFEELYKSGVRCYQFSAIDLLPANIVLLFHGYTDTENSLYSNSILLISLSKQFDVSESLDCTQTKKKSSLSSMLPGDCKSVSQFEHQINRFLRSQWNKYLGNEEVDAILSRLTTNILIFHTYDHLQNNFTCLSSTSSSSSSSSSSS